MTSLVERLPDGRIGVRVGKVEIGQGLHTALAQIAADALGVPLARVDMLPVDTDASPDQGVTSGSRSIEEAGPAVREACAAWRARSGTPDTATAVAGAATAVAGAATIVAGGATTVAGAASAVVGAATTVAGATSTVAGAATAVAGAASAVADRAPTGTPRAPEAARAPPPSAADREVGRCAPRRDLPALFAGAPHFIHDLAPAGLLHGRVLHPPRHGARVAAWHEAVARDAAGLVHLARDGALFGVVCETGALADRALERLEAAVAWRVDADPAEGPEDLLHLPGATRVVAERRADVAVAATLDARYTRPWIAHASIAPSCALARWDDDTGRLEVWSHTQGPFNLRRDLALAFGLDARAVRVVHAPGAGCYGHNGADDVAFDAAWLARGVPGRPLMVRWRRADELSHSPFGPAMAVSLEAGLDGAGRIVHWEHEVCSPGHSRRPGRSATPALLGAWQVAAAHAVPESIDMPLATGGGAERNAVPGYDFPSLAVRCRSVRTIRRSSALRALGAFVNVFAAECFLDEIANATGTDPLALRRRHLQHDPRALRVLDAAVERAGWAGRRRGEEGVGHGLAQARYKGTGAWCAVVAEVHAAEVLRVRRLTVAVDVGLAVNPDGVASQVEGGAIQATSWALKESAAAAHAGWADYPILRFTEVPQVDVLVLPSDEPSLGAGEASLGPTAAAIGNALFDALGVRVRDLPLTPERIVAAMDAAPRQPT